jgi:hypothetical protein
MSPSGETEARNQRRTAISRSNPPTLCNMTHAPFGPPRIFPVADCFDGSSREHLARVNFQEFGLRPHQIGANRTLASTAPQRTVASDPLDSDPGKTRRELAADVDRHRELRPPYTPHLGMPTGRHLGTPRPMRSRVTTTGGRFPGSRVIAFDHLPRDNRPQWLLWPSARRLQLRGQLRNCIPVIAAGHAHRIPLVIPLRGTTVCMLASRSA